MKQLYCPWRETYSSDDNSKGRQAGANKMECIFCIQFASDNDAKHFILKRYKHNIVILNKFPYNAGHVMIIPYDHVSDLDMLSAETRQEMMELTNTCIILLRNALKAEGINLGMNLGTIGGAGIPSHVHMHVIPRYARDTNFLVTVADTKQISYDLQAVFEKLESCLRDCQTP